ncbi:MAG: thiolase family protein [Ignavibacteriales bacterium]|nr:thiolase family protein [Ignavibacteriales bacterium]
MAGTKNEAVLVEAIRTPVGKYGGSLKDIRVDDLSAFVLRSLVERTNLDPGLIDDVLWGCANQAGEDNRNLGRMAVLLAGFPQTIPATTINRLCGSSLDAINYAARAVWSGDHEIVVAGGAESMTRAPYVFAKNVTGGALFGNLTGYDTALGWRFPNPRMEQLFPLESMGETAENISERWKISREDQDAFACRSHECAVKAQNDGTFAEEIVPVEIPRQKGDPVVVEKDDGPRPDTSLEKLASLSPAFRKGGTVTAGNSSSLNDGAAAVLVMSEGRSKKLRFKPIVRIVSTGISGVDPRCMGVGPVPATQMALKRAGLKLDDIGVIELNEAFAAQSLAVIRDLGADPERVNPHGGAIALGHPLGCSGARIMTTLVHEMKRRNVRYGLATMCIGVGQGIATIVELAR